MAIDFCVLTLRTSPSSQLRVQSVRLNFLLFAKGPLSVIYWTYAPLITRPPPPSLSLGSANASVSSPKDRSCHLDTRGRTRQGLRILTNNDLSCTYGFLIALDMELGFSR